MTGSTSDEAPFLERLIEVLNRFVPEPATDYHEKQVHESSGRRYLELLDAATDPRPAVHHLTLVDARLASRLFSTLPPREALKRLRNSPYREQRTDEQRLDELEVYAHLETFGKILVDAAKKCLPVSVHAQAELFRRTEDPNRRFEILTLAYESLRKENWDENFGLLARCEFEHELTLLPNDDWKRYTPWMVLPHIFGRFPESPIRPNCLGMALLCAAWCELAGARYMFASLLDYHSQQQWRYLAQMTRRIQSFVESRQIPVSSAEAWGWGSDLETAASVHDHYDQPGSYNAHAFVVLELAPGENWAGLDPWQDRCFWMDGEESEYYAARDIMTPKRAYDMLERFRSTIPGLTLMQRRWIIEENFRYLNAELEQSFSLTEMLHDVKRYYERNFGFQGEESWQAFFFLMGAALAQEAPEHTYTQFLRERAEPFRYDHPGWDDPSRYHGMLLQLALWHRWRRKDEPFERFLQMAIHRYSSDAAFAQRVRDEVVLMYVDTARLQAVELMRSHCRGKGKTRSGHPLVEYGRPYLQFGCAVLAHLYAYDEWTQFRLRPSELLPYTTSQMVTLDALTDIDYRAADRLEDIEDFKIVLLSDGEEPPAPSEPAQTFSEWLQLGGQSAPDSLEWPSSWFLTPEGEQYVREAWRHLEETPRPMLHELTRRFILRMQFQQIHQHTQPQEAVDVTEEEAESRGGCGSDHRVAQSGADGCADHGATRW